MIDLSIIILSFNTEKLTRECIESVVKNTKGITYEFLVMDNASKDGSLEMLKKLSQKLPLKLIANKDNIGFGLANNQGMKEACGRYLLLLNSDTLVKDNVLGEMVKWMDENLKVGISSCALKNKDGSLQRTGGYFPTLFRVFAWMSFLDDIPLFSKLIKPYHSRSSSSESRDWLTGAYLLIRRRVFEDVGYFDKDYFMYVEEIDYAYRAKEKGWQVWFLSKWSITHYGGASGTSGLAAISEYKSLKVFYKKHYPKWQTCILRLFLRLGALPRLLFNFKIYAKVFCEA
ncbi:MAG: glycosyltransferase family 2 protein [Candidatus Woesebacteria bacterium]|nr:glycosyltransferase family 2 protein [Candidatus Woesebacteria bacterium]